MNKQLVTKAYLHALSSNNCYGQVVAQRCNLLEKRCCIEPPATCKTSHVTETSICYNGFTYQAKFTAMLPALVGCYHAQTWIAANSTHDTCGPVLSCPQGTYHSKQGVM